MQESVELRAVIPANLPIFYEQQLDPIAVEMAVFPSREKSAFDAHWAKILSNNQIQIRTILYGGQVAGNVLCFKSEDKTEVGYWLGRPYWGKGIATQDLKLFLELISLRPPYAHVAQHNAGSRRLLEKCGFKLVGEDLSPFRLGNDDITECVFRLN